MVHLDFPLALANNGGAGKGGGGVVTGGGCWQLLPVEAPTTAIIKLGALINKPVRLNRGADLHLLASLS